MQAQSGQVTTPALQALLADGTLTGEWVLDPRESTIRLRNRTMGGLATVKGSFHEVSGYGMVSRDGQVSGTLVVSAASIDTKNARRDKHLRSADFFDTENYPEISFTVQGVRPSGERFAVTGALTVRDCTRPVSFDAVAAVQDEGEISLDADVHVNQREFGLIWNWLGTVGANNALTIHAVFARP
jgi:polyisoprenoid-binding protein YceI